jgi:3-oxoacyl-[acyl-carrier protein] reductase
MVATGAALHPSLLERAIAGTPLGRIGEVDDVSNAVIWMLSEEARHSTGTIVDVSGGQWTQ